MKIVGIAGSVLDATGTLLDEEVRCRLREFLADHAVHVSCLPGRA